MASGIAVLCFCWMAVFVAFAVQLHNEVSILLKLAAAACAVIAVALVRRPS